MLMYPNLKACCPDCKLDFFTNANIAGMDHIGIKNLNQYVSRVGWKKNKDNKYITRCMLCIWKIGPEKNGLTGTFWQR